MSDERTEIAHVAIRHLRKAGADHRDIARFLAEIGMTDADTLSDLSNMPGDEAEQLTDEELATIDRDGFLRVHLTPDATITFTRRSLELIARGPVPRTSTVARNLILYGGAYIADAADAPRRLFLNLSEEDVHRNLYGDGLFIPGTWETVHCPHWGEA